jgi:type I restriction enzyme R subunit
LADGSAAIDNHAGLIWAITHLLRGDYKQSEYARANPIENFRLVFADAFIKSIVGRMDDNQDVFKKILDDPAFQSVVMDHYLHRVFIQARLER